MMSYIPIPVSQQDEYLPIQIGLEEEHIRYNLNTSITQFGWYVTCLLLPKYGRTASSCAHRRWCRDRRPVINSVGREPRESPESNPVINGVAHQ